STFPPCFRGLLGKEGTSGALDAATAVGAGRREAVAQWVRGPESLAPHRENYRLFLPPMPDFSPGPMRTRRAQIVAEPLLADSAGAPPALRPLAGCPPPAGAPRPRPPHPPCLSSRGRLRGAALPPRPPRPAYNQNVSARRQEFYMAEKITPREKDYS